MAEVKYILFTLGNQKYGINLENINGIEQSYVIVPVPAGAEYVKGIIHLREMVIPVIDVKKRLGLMQSRGEDARLLLSDTHNIKVAVEVDQVLGIFSVDEQNVKKVPNVVRGEDTDYLENIIKVEQDGASEIMISISIDHLLSDEEYEDVSTVLNEAME